jgi:hypothetical protein
LEIGRHEWAFAAGTFAAHRGAPLGVHFSS